MIRGGDMIPRRKSLNVKTESGELQMERPYGGTSVTDDRIIRGGHRVIPRKESTDTPLHHPGFRERNSRGGVRVGESGGRPLRTPFPTGLSGI